MIRRGRVRVLVVDDDDLVADMMRVTLGYDPGLEIVGVATNGAAGVAACHRLRPDVVTMDIHMPIMDGIAAVTRIMAECPTPIMVLSSDYTERMVFECMARRAVDVVEKPRMAMSDAACREFCAYLRFVAGVHVARAPAPPPPPPAPPARPIRPAPAGAARRLIGVVASTGGPDAVRVLLKALPGDLPAGLLVVQHMSAGFTPGMVQWLNGCCALDVRLARDGELARPGAALFAPDGRHLLVDRGGVVRLSDHDDGTGYRPSGDALLDALATAYGPRALAVVLTGMGADGAVGLARVAKAGGLTLAQDPADALVGGMPAEAIATGSVRHVAPLARLPLLLQGAVRETGA